MGSNVLLETTVRAFENGIDEINKVKSSLDRLKIAIDELVNFNGFASLELSDGKIEQIKSGINNIILEQKRYFQQYESSIEELKIAQSSEISNLAKGLGNFLADAENIRTKLKGLSSEVEFTNIQEVSTKSKEFLLDIQKQYKELEYEFKNINELGSIVESLKTTVDETNEKVKNENIGEKFLTIQKIIQDFQENYYDLNKNYGKLNEDIFNQGSNHILELTTSIEKLNYTAEQFYNRLLCISKGIETEELQKTFNDTNSLVKLIYEDIEVNYKNVQNEYDKLSNTNKEFSTQLHDTRNQWQELLSRFQSFKNIESYKDTIIEEIMENRKVNKVLEDKIRILEDQLKVLSNENKNLEELYFLKSNEDREFQKLILTEIKKLTDNSKQVNGIVREQEKFSQNLTRESKNNEKSQNKPNNTDEGLPSINHNVNLDSQQKHLELADYLQEANKGNATAAEKVIKIYEALAQSNDVNAKYRLGDIYYTGLWGYKNDFKAFHWYEAAENQCHMEAKIKAGQVAYDIGEGFLKLSTTIAIGWYKTALEKGNANAKIRIREIYNDGYVD